MAEGSKAELSPGQLEFVSHDELFFSVTVWLGLGASQQLDYAFENIMVWVKDGPLHNIKRILQRPFWKKLQG